MRGIAEPTDPITSPLSDVTKWHAAQVASIWDTLALPIGAGDDHMHGAEIASAAVYGHH
jgi:hypothetical protein